LCRRKFEDPLGDVIRLGDVFKDESFFFRRALNFNASVAENGMNESVDFAGHILDVVEHEFAHRSPEQSVLFNIDDAMIGDDPDVKPPVDKILEEEQPRVQKEYAHAENEEGEARWVAQELRCAVFNGEVGHEREEERKDEPEQKRKDGKPMTTKEENRPFVLLGIEDSAEIDHCGWLMSLFACSLFGFLESRINQQANQLN
jgi:hypothetical protein